jgi:hypothetical protein
MEGSEAGSGPGEHGQKDFYPAFRVVLGQAGTTGIGEGYVQDIQDTNRSTGGSPRQGSVTNCIII